MSIILKIFLSIFSGFAMYLSWSPRTHFTWLSFFALTPLLLIANENKKTNKKYIAYPIIAFFVWNITTTGWIYFANSYGAFATFLLNTVFMSVPWILFFYIYKKNDKIAFVALCAFWLSFECLHFYWDISFPWLTIGNLFASHPAWIQWYEYTGVAGGTLWVLLSNILFYNVLLKNKKKINLLSLISLACVLIIPFSFSYYLYFSLKKELNKPNISKNNIVIVQPNYEAYTEKFNIPEDIQIKHFLKLSEKTIDSQTRVVIFPETALTNLFWEHNYKKSASVQQLVTWLQKNPSVSIIGGANTNKEKKTDLKTPATRSFDFEGQKIFYETYNTSFILYADTTINFYHKSQLVPAAEKMPFQKHLYFLGDLMINLGGINGTLGTQDTPTNFVLKNTQVKIAPLICYESIYPAFVASFVKKGANILVVITNDGWWKDTDGYKQHASYSQLRAIENRRYLYRSANTGISTLINPLGEKEQELGWNKEGTIKASLLPSEKLTFYSKNKDIIYYLACFLTLLISIKKFFKSKFLKKIYNLF